MENKSQLLNRFKKVQKGNAIFVNEEELILCEELKSEGKVNFKIARNTELYSDVMQLADPIYLK
ncbi:hypothetical protein [Staphylococcus casei]|uniref:RNA methyltransferase n=1 Tax=Staphylococcus casei TaxID=201828 RepID=A0ABZ2WE78_9STAP